MSNTENKRAVLIKDVSLILRDLLKTIKVVSLYPEDNPLPQSLKRSFAERLVELIANNGDILISVEKERLNFDNEVVFRDNGKEERLAGIFFDTGITDFTFKDGLCVEDVYTLLDVLKKYLNTADKSLDLVGVLWESGMNAFTFATLEDIALSQYDGGFNIQVFAEEEGSVKGRRAVFGTDGGEGYHSIFDLYPEASAADLDERSQTGTPNRGVNLANYGPPGVAPAPGVTRLTVLDQIGLDGAVSGTSAAAAAMGLDDLPAGPVPTADTALILNSEFELSSEEAANVIRLVAEDAQFDMYESTQQLLQEILHQETEMPGFFEAVIVCEKVFSEYVQLGKLIHARQLLEYLRYLEGDLAKSKPMWAAKLKEAFITAGSRDRLGLLAEALNSHPDVSAGEVTRYLEIFDWHALSGITDLLGRLEHRQHREALCNYLVRQGRENAEIISKGIFDKRWYVVRNSITILAQIGDDRSLDYLKRTAGHEDKRVRLELVRVLQDCPNDRAMGVLTLLVKDKDKEIRTAAVNAIVARHGQPAFDAVTAVIGAADFYELDLDDQRPLLKAYSVLGGELAVPFLSQIILKLNLFGEKTLAQYRQVAFEALTHNRSEKAERLLVKLSGSWRPDIRQQAAAALAERRKIIYGGD